MVTSLSYLRKLSLCCWSSFSITAPTATRPISSEDSEAFCIVLPLIFEEQLKIHYHQIRNAATAVERSLAVKTAVDFDVIVETVVAELTDAFETPTMAIIVVAVEFVSVFRISTTWRSPRLSSFRRIIAIFVVNENCVFVSSRTLLFLLRSPFSKISVVSIVMFCFEILALGSVPFQFGRVCMESSSSSLSIHNTTQSKNHWSLLCQALAREQVFRLEENLDYLPGDVSIALIPFAANHLLSMLLGFDIDVNEISG